MLVLLEQLVGITHYPTFPMGGQWATPKQCGSGNEIRRWGDLATTISAARNWLSTCSVIAMCV